MPAFMKVQCLRKDYYVVKMDQAILWYYWKQYNIKGVLDSEDELLNPDCTRVIW